MSSLITDLGSMLHFYGEERKDEYSTELTYYGFTKAIGILENEPRWKIYRIFKSGNITKVEYASNEFNKKWSERFDLFPFSESTKSVLFDGVNDKITTNIVDAFKFNNGINDLPFSISLWTKLVDATLAMFITKGNINNREWRLYTSASDFFGISLDGGVSGTPSISCSSVAALTADQGSWIHLAAIYNGNGTKEGLSLYRNGVSMAVNRGMVGTYTGMRDSLESAVIGHWLTTSYYLSGNMDELSIWNKALTQAEITELYNEGTPSNLAQHSAAANLLSWYYMGDGDAYPVIKDHKSVNDGTMVNMTSGSIVTDAP